jgi:hypothetical protein
MNLKLRTIAVGTLLIFGIMANHYWPRRDLRVSTDPKWLQVVQFIRSADEVKTFATKADLESEAQLTSAVKQNSGELRTVTIRKLLLDHLAILPSIPGNESPPAACFCPHHFVFAKKGKATLRLDICYGCGSCGVRSTEKILPAASRSSPTREWILVHCLDSKPADMQRALDVDTSQTESPRARQPNGSK